MPADGATSPLARVLVSTANGAAIAYALWNLEERGPMFIEPGAQIYEGMIIGAHCLSDWQ
jgi:predicted membrane GTPase involved in stress response